MLGNICRAQSHDAVQFPSLITRSVKLKDKKQALRYPDTLVPMYDRMLLIHFNFFFNLLRILFRVFLFVLSVWLVDFGFFVLFWFFLAFYIQCPLAPSESIRDGSVNFAVNR